VGLSQDDAELVRRCLVGNHQAMRQLIERFEGDCFGLCYRILNHRQDAEDVVQETFIRAFRSLKSWDSTRPLKPWILSIAFNRCRTWIVKRGKRPELVDYLHETASKEPQDDAKELISEIRLALRDMRPEFCSVFTMFHEQGIAYEEIAEAMGRPVGTIKTWLHRARTEVLTALKARGMVPADETPTTPERP
jgi:RNA polymerase sigma factor (sigma-70 family)